MHTYIHTYIHVFSGGFEWDDPSMGGELDNDPDRQWVGHSEYIVPQTSNSDRWRGSTGAKTESDRRKSGGGGAAQMAVDEEGSAIEWASGNDYFE